MVVIYHVVSICCAYVQQTPRLVLLLNILASPEISLSELIVIVSS